MHISAQVNEKLLSIISIVKLLAESLDCTDGTLGFQGTPVEDYCRSCLIKLKIVHAASQVVLYYVCK